MVDILNGIKSLCCGSRSRSTTPRKETTSLERREAAFQYDPLEHPKTHIRLLQLHPGQFHQPINITLNQVPLNQLESSGGYEALSYVWGSSERANKVICNSAILKVTVSLNVVLRYLRNEDATRVLWVDAVCIDQTNPDERNEQVLLMDQIYKNASCVIGWIGEEASDSARAMAMDFKGRAFDDVDADVVRHISDEEWTAVYYVLRRPWFTRAWIIQEVALAKSITIQCGHQSMTWDNFIVSFRLLADPLLRGQSDLEKFDQIQGMTTFVAARKEIQGTQHMSVEKAFTLTRHCHATDAHDMVYSILGLLSNEIRSAIKPDYRLSYWEAFRDVSKSIIQQSGSLRVLSMASPQHPLPPLPFSEPEASKGIEESPKEFMPSWVIDWTVRHQENTYDKPLQDTMSQLDTDASRYRATGDSKVSLQNSASPIVLLLHGKIIGTLTSCSRGFQHNAVAQVERRSPERPMEWTWYMAWMLTVAEGLKGSASDIYSPTGETKAEAHWRTLVANRWNHPNLGPQATPPTPAMGHWMSKWLELMKQMDPTQAHKWTSVGWDRLTYTRRIEGKPPMDYDEAGDVLPGVMAWSAMRGGIHGRCFCTIGDEFMGLAPPTAKEGDVVVVLYGGNVPYVLRRVGTDENTEQDDGAWVYIGEAYVHGMMDGEAMRENDMPQRLFTIQ